ncbi:MAG: signal peptide peptidase SppA [Gammaproteobacteria bacterium]|nr:signal peptide peptidase SppA [Gammaproteobacteria bacterium]
MEENSKKSSFERDVVEKLAFSAITEQRRARRWKIFFIFLFFIYLFAAPILMSGKFEWPDIEKGEKHTALVDLEGVISSKSEASADKVVTALRDAFEDEDTAGVILRINSPGGSPVQSSYIYNEMKRLREKYPDIPLYSVITDLCASGGYYVAVGADKIYANESSIVGSIGVIMNGFGFEGTMEKLGVERRALTAGEHKALFDPFSPMKEEEKAHLQVMLEDIHEQFINTVKEGREGKLAEDEKLFSGLVWTGDKARALGLVDEFGSAGYVAREVIKVEDIVDFTGKRDLFDRFAERFGASVYNQLNKIW